LEKIESALHQTEKRIAASLNEKCIGLQNRFNENLQKVSENSNHLQSKSFHFQGSDLKNFIRNELISSFNSRPVAPEVLKLEKLIVEKFNSYQKEEDLVLTYLKNDLKVLLNTFENSLNDFLKILLKI